MKQIPIRRERFGLCVDYLVGLAFPSGLGRHEIQCICIIFSSPYGDFYVGIFQDLFSIIEGHPFYATHLGHAPHIVWDKVPLE